VVIQQALLAHYRACVYNELINSGRHEYAFASGPGNTEPTIKTWTPPATTRFFPTHTYIIKALNKRGIVLQPGVIKLALRSDIDVLILLGVAWHPFTWIAAILARLTGKRVLYWTQGFTRPETGLAGKVRAAFYKLPNALLLYGHYGKVMCLQRGINSTRLHVIYNSLDYPAQQRERQSVTRDELVALRNKVVGTDQLPIAICTTRLMPVRRLDLLIDAAAILKHQGREIALLIVGDGPEKAKLQAHARASGVRCTFYGACYDEAVLSRLIMMSNCMVAPGKVGLTSLHALAYGTPVVTHNNEANQMPEWEAIMPGRTGTLFADGNTQDLARAIAHWTADPWPREDVRQDCWTIVQRLWNPAMQRVIIDRAVDGAPADDLFWLKEDHGPPADSARA
jgi:glycosyltransferase involved in cell wall biosynthesis